MKEYGLYHFKKCWFKTHIVLFFPFWAICEKGSCVGYICIVWSILMINTSMASKEVRLLSKEEGRKESSIGLLSKYTYYLVLWEAIIWKSPSPPIPPTPHHIRKVNFVPEEENPSKSNQSLNIQTRFSMHKVSTKNSIKIY